MFCDIFAYVLASRYLCISILLPRLVLLKNILKPETIHIFKRYY